MTTQDADYVRIWQVVRRVVQPGSKGDLETLADSLAEGWEPFAVTWDGHAFDYHLRRLTDV